MLFCRLGGGGIARWERWRWRAPEPSPWQGIQERWLAARRGKSKPKKTKKERDEAQKLRELEAARKGWPVREPRFDQAAERERKRRFLLLAKELLAREPLMVIRADDLGKRKKELRVVSPTLKVVRKLRRHPSAFEFVRDPDDDSKTWCGFTPDSLSLLREETTLREEYAPEGVRKVRKLLMMSAHKRILLEKFVHIKQELGLPDDFQESWFEKHPEFFCVKQDGERTYLELVEWDPALAVTTLEKQAMKSLATLDKGTCLVEPLDEEASRVEEDMLNNRILSMQETTQNVNGPHIPMVFRKGYSPSKARMRKIAEFQSALYLSPYQNSPNLCLVHKSPKAERFSVALLHEVLSLTLEKRMMLEHLGQFKNDFCLPGKLLLLLLRYDGVFYVTQKPFRSIVFLKEAYKGSELIMEKCPLVLWKDKFLDIAEKRKPVAVIPTLSTCNHPARAATKHQKEKEESDLGVEAIVDKGNVSYSYQQGSLCLR